MGEGLLLDPQKGRNLQSGSSRNLDTAFFIPCMLTRLETSTPRVYSTTDSLSRKRGWDWDLSTSIHHLSIHLSIYIYIPPVTLMGGITAANQTHPLFVPAGYLPPAVELPGFSPALPPLSFLPLPPLPVLVPLRSCSDPGPPPHPCKT